MGIRPELSLDDLVKRIELPTSCMTLSKHEKEFCGFFKNVKVPSSYSMNVSRLTSFPDLKVAPVWSLMITMYCLCRWLLLEFKISYRSMFRRLYWTFAFFNAIGQKVLSEEALESLEKRHYETLCFLEMYFPPVFFDISVYFTTHIIKEIKLLSPMFLD
jgi:hypothetical protein